MKNICLLFVSMAMVLVLGYSPYVNAQDEFTLEEITVTAEKRKEDVQKTPLSISIVSSEKIAEKSLNSVQDILRGVVGVQLQGAGGAADGDSESIFIRGIGLNNMDMQWGDPAVALNVDGVQQQRESALFDSMVDVERVEVLRGPQGTLYGRNATGGVINVVMVQPKDYLEASATVKVGNYNHKGIEGILNVPIYDKLALRFSGVTEERDGYITGGPRDRYRKKTSARLKALFNASQDITLSGTVEYNLVKETPQESVPPSNLNADDPWHNIDSRITATDKYNQKKTLSANLELNWDIGDWTVFTFIPTMLKWKRHSWFPFMVTGAVNPNQTEPDLFDETQYTYEARFANEPDSKLVWVLGGFYWDSESGAVGNEQIVESTTPRVSFLQRPTGSWAVFGQGTYPVNDRFRIVAGGRYSYDDRSSRYRIYTTNDPAEGEDLEIVYDSGIREVSNISKKATFKFGLEYDLRADSMVYFQASQGYKPGGITFSQLLDDNLNFVNLAESKFDPEESIAYEIGSKNRFLDDRLQINGSLFYTFYKNAQVQYPTIANEGTSDEEFMMLVENAGTSKMYGVEIETTWLITAKDLLTVGMSSMKGEYGKLIIQSGNPPGTPGFGPMVDLTGSTMANMPKFTLQLSYEHTWDLGYYGSLKAGFDTTYKTKYFNRVDTWLDAAEVPSHYISNINLNWSSPKDRWSAGAYVKNIEDKAIALDTRGNGTEVMLNTPRTFGVRVTYRYR